MNKISQMAIWSVWRACACVVATWLALARPAAAELPRAIDDAIAEAFPDSDIPGLAVVVVRDGHIATRVLGHARGARAVTEDTLFELASCSKAFTALAVLQLEAEGRLVITDPVSRYLPGFHVTYKGKYIDVTIEQLLHHKTGLSMRAIGRIPAEPDRSAMLHTAQRISGYEVNEPPGRAFEYSSLNYDVLGAVIEVVSGRDLATYLHERIFAPLGLTQTQLLHWTRPPELAQGHKLGLLRAWPYDAPLYPGNAPSAYIASTPRDLARWLAIQLHAIDTPLAALIARSHEPDREVAPDALDGGSYAAGWSVYQRPLGEIAHAGGNPSFTSFVGFSPGGRFGVAVLANSNSPRTAALGARLLALLRGDAPPPLPRRDGALDRACTVASLVMAVLVLAALAATLRVALEVRRGRRRWRRPTRGALAVGTAALALLAALVAATCWLPRTLAELPFDVAVVWMPISFPIALAAFAAALAAGYLLCVVSALFPMGDGLRGALPSLVALCLAAGVSNAALIFVIVAAPGYHGSLAAILGYYGLIAAFYLASRRYVDGAVVALAYRVVHDLRARLTQRVLAARFQELERVDAGRVAATLNNDTQSLGQGVHVVAPLITNAVTTIAVGIYLATVSLVAFSAAGLGVLAIAILYVRVERRSRRLWTDASQAQARFVHLLDGLVRGFNELAMHARKRRGFGADMDDALGDHAAKRTRASLASLNAFIFGEALLVLALGTIAFVFPRVVDGFDAAQLTTLVMALLYLLGPIMGLMGALPTVAEARATWQRIRAFERDLNESAQAPALRALPAPAASAARLAFDRVAYQYPARDDGPGFSVGPLSFAAASGEILFVIGGNGSGKSTVAKLLTGLYGATSGAITIDGRAVDPAQLGELVSVVFADFHLFPRLYDVELAGKEALVDHHLDVLRLKHKVTLDDRGFSTLELSTGQRKRLALLKCFLEDRPILLFDEWAADQDPEFRQTFYRELLPALRRAGKLVIAITHDDHYFDLADQIVCLELGQLRQLKPAQRAAG